jgi:hypothetical protein
VVEETRLLDAKPAEEGTGAEEDSRPPAVEEEEEGILDSSRGAGSTE